MCETRFFIDYLSGYIGVAKSESALSFAELARVFEVTSLAKLQNCKNI